MSRKSKKRIGTPPPELGLKGKGVAPLVDMK